MNNHRPCKILISSLDAFGHVNVCLGIGAFLAERGNEVYFLNKSMYKKSGEEQGMKFLAIEDYAEKGEEKEEGPGFAKFFDEFYDKHKKPILEQLRSSTEEDIKMMGTLFETIQKIVAVVKKIIAEFHFDILLGDFIFRTPFLYQCPIPFVPIISYNPLVLYNGPPFGSGLSTNGDQAKWQEFIDAEKKMNDGMMGMYAKCFEEAGLEVPTVLESRTYAKELGIYVFSEVMDYTELGNPKDQWVRMESAIRKSTGTEFQIPECLKDKPGKLIFFSLGSLGTACLKLINELLETLSKSPNRFIVSKGALGDQLDLPNNMWGQNYVNQLAILPKVDLVITHGGNNTLLETLAAGKPMIVMPLFGDQLDNAQRIHDVKLGRRINPFQYEDEQLLQSIEELFNDTTIKDNLAYVTKRIRKSVANAQAAEYVESLARTGVRPNLPRYVLF